MKLGVVVVLVERGLSLPDGRAVGFVTRAVNVFGAAGSRVYFGMRHLA